MSLKSHPEEHNAKLPIWALTPQENKRARTNLKTFAYKECHEYVKAMAECAKHYSVKMFPNCDEQRNKMKECLLYYQYNESYLEHQRDLIVLEKIKKREDQLKQ